MTTYIRCKQLWQIAIAFVATSGVIFSWNSAAAQIVPDKTLGTESSVVTPNVDIKGLPSDRIDGGAIRGANLFHSFQEFSVREARGAYFSNPAGIENIFSRVTGNNSSNINGKLGVLGNANLFLLNPNGIIFGPNASLDIGGSFVGSTANSLNFGDGKQFSATNPTAPPLLTVTVPLGVQFNQAQPSAIVNSGNLLAGTGQNLTLLGGTVVSTGQLSAPGGQVAVAAVPGGSVVNLSPSGQLLNIETPSPVLSVGSSSLTELLRSVDEKVRPGLTVNSNGQVELTGSGLPVVDGDVVARNVTAKTGTLTANHNLTLAESQLGTTGDLNLLAGDTVRVRDSVANPFVAKAGGNFTIRGDKGIDILALNHPQTPFVSGGNLSLISDGNISGDAHFSSGGNFSILNLSGSGGNFVSLYDPIVRSNGDVEIGNYTGASLKIEAAGNIKTGAITINRSEDTSAVRSDPDSLTLTGGRALILRAGRDTLSGSVQEFDPLDGASSVNYSSSPSSAGSLTVGNITSGQDPQTGSLGLLKVDLLAKGDINTQNITANGGDITLKSETGNISAVSVQTRATTGNAGSINFNANRDITITAEMRSLADQGESRDIFLESKAGSISTRDISTSAFANKGGRIFITASGNITTGNLDSFIDYRGKGVAGDVNLTAAGNIRSGNIRALSHSDNQGFSTIQLESSAGSVFLDGVTLSTTNTGTDNAGDIYINGKNIQIDNRTSIESRGVFGRIFIGKKTTPDKVTINNSTIDTINTGTENAGDIYIDGRNIQIDSSKILSQGVVGRIFIGGTYQKDKNNVTAENVTIRNSSVDTQTFPRVTSNLKPNLDDADGIQIFSLGGIQIENSSLSATTNSQVPAGNVFVVARRSILLSGNEFTDFSNLVNNNKTPKAGLLAEATEGGIAGNILIFTNDLSIVNGAAVTVSSPEGQGGNVVILANRVFLNNGALLATTGQPNNNPGDGSNIILLGLSGEKTTSEALKNLGSLIEESNLASQGKKSLPGSPLDFLILGNESLIATNAKNSVDGGNSADGGNIAIKTQLLLALPPTGNNGNNISANAEGKGSGGVVAIDPRPYGIYGIEFQSKPQNFFNDITASSEQGPQGTVAIVPIDADPKRGIIQLPEKLGDSSKLIAQSCPVGVSRAASRFVVTGRGGLPPNPSSALSSDALVGNASSPANNRPEQTSSTSSTPVEAQGVVIGSKGEIILTANPSKLTSYRSWQRFTGCNE